MSTTEIRSSDKLRIISRGLFTGLAIAATAMIIYENAAVFGAVAYYSSINDSSDLSPLGPKERVEEVWVNGERVTKQTSDIVYFSTFMPRDFERAWVKVTYQNPTPDQDIRVGYHDRTDWHYHTKLMDSPTLNSVPWDRVGSDYVLYQKNIKYHTVPDFLQQVPPDEPIGLYNVDASLLPPENFTLPGYTPSDRDTVVDTPLRGKHVFYAYLENEPFHMIIEKQDINWYTDPDIMTVDIYKGNSLVLQQTIDDDGITDDSGKIGPVQTADIKNPGPDLPESGLYKIVIDGGGDTVIKKITTNLHKIVVAGPVYPVANAQNYPGLVEKTTPSKLFARDIEVNLESFHSESTQSALLNDTELTVSKTHTLTATSSATPITSIVLPKSDVVINGIPGYYAFSEDSFFIPKIYLTYQLQPGDSYDHFGYIFAQYDPPVTQGEWQTATVNFDIGDAVTDGDNLSWIIDAPGLKENENSVIIKRIDVELRKKPWFTLGSLK